jgi:hypothetical protein
MKKLAEVAFIVICLFFIIFTIVNLGIAIVYPNVNVYVNGGLKYSGNSRCVDTSSVGNNIRVWIGKRWTGCLFTKALYVSSDVVVIPGAEDVEE